MARLVELKPRAHTKDGGSKQRVKVKLKGGWVQVLYM